MVPGDAYGAPEPGVRAKGKYMAYTIENWKERIAKRSDITSGLVHLTRPKGGKSTLEVLLSILKDRRLIGSTTESGFIVGNTPAVCFQEAPLYSVAQNIYTEQEYRKENPSAKIRYYGCGIQVTKSDAFNAGGRPVIYEKTSVAKNILPESEYWRIVNFDLSNDDSVIDWTHEREWRVPHDFDFELSDIMVLLPNTKLYREFLSLCRSNEELSHIPTEIKGIIHMGSMFF